MQIFKDHKALFIWFFIAIAGTFYGHYSPKHGNFTNSKNQKDTLIHFTFSAEQHQNLSNIFTNLNKRQGFNGAVLVGQNDSIFYSEAFGYANYANKDSLNLQSSFQLASVSKQFTAVAILQLYEKGKLDLKDSIQRFFPDFPYKNITIHQLLVHRSGLPNYHYFLQHIPTTTDTIISNIDVVNEMINKKPKAYYFPNRRYHYSNTGYAILAAIVEKVSRTSFQDYLKQNIFSPLKMHNSFAYRGIDNQKLQCKTKGYLRRWRLAEDNYLDGVLGDKGIYCSAEDLFKWDQGLYKNIIINPDTLSLAFKAMGKPSYFKSNYGYGWRMFSWGSDTTKVLFHAGWWHGYKTLLLRIPEDKTSIIVLKNRSSGPMPSTKSLLNLLYPEKIENSDSVKQDSIKLVSTLM